MLAWYRLPEPIPYPPRQAATIPGPALHEPMADDAPAELIDMPMAA
jgi:hypothetical protein